MLRPQRRAPAPGGQGRDGEGRDRGWGEGGSRPLSFLRRPPERNGLCASLALTPRSAAAFCTGLPCRGAIPDPLSPAAREFRKSNLFPDSSRGTPLCIEVSLTVEIPADIAEAFMARNKRLPARLPALARSTSVGTGEGSPSLCTAIDREVAHSRACKGDPSAALPGGTRVKVLTLTPQPPQATCTQCQPCPSRVDLST